MYSMHDQNWSEVMPSLTKSALKEKVVREFKNFAVIFFYVWIILGLFTLHKALILHLRPLNGQVFALINALVLGKVILLLEILKVGEVFPSKPRVVRVLVKAAMYGLLLLAFNVVEESIKGWFDHKTFTESIAEIGGGRLEGMLIVAVITGTALIPYLICQEVSRAMGRERLIYLLLKSPGASEVAPVTKPTS
jgi:hypothetical protein